MEVLLKMRPEVKAPIDPIPKPTPTPTPTPNPNPNPNPEVEATLDNMTITLTLPLTLTLILTLNTPYLPGRGRARQEEPGLQRARQRCRHGPHAPGAP